MVARWFDRCQVAIERVSGKSPEAYFGNNSHTENLIVCKLTEEIEYIDRVSSIPSLTAITLC
ncbi:hypothetical protein [Chamaesiphon sp. VAR_69_metabat_338]|uniref:hypothetical protein n=1 Tax=Chamaesiphon sp. VAR_69_metabat_338 TaxID=2964704 RepID=UPI00286D9F94|nr:hypothetical protein [Chamaesiphon sp. VAR_69_metabat_338]